MTRTAVEEGFEYFVDEVSETTLEEFSVARALRGGSRGSTGAVVDSLLKSSETLHRRVVQPELESYRRQTLDQFGVVLDAVESDEAIDTYREKILESGPVGESIRADIPPERQREVKDHLLTHHRGVGEAVEPLIDSDEDDFWEAAATALTRAEARTLVREQFPFTGPLRRHRDALRMETTVDVAAVVGGIATMLPTTTLEVEFTDEAIRAMYRAEQSVVQRATDEIDRRFD